jgi:hypothetical protein
MTDLELAKAIRARLLEYGHMTGGLGPPEGPNCVMGAAFQVTGFYRRVGELRGTYVAQAVGISQGVQRVLGLTNDQIPATVNDREPETIIPRLDAYIAAHEANMVEEPVYA